MEHDSKADVQPKPNCSAVAGLLVSWDFANATWKAKFVEGPHLDITKTLGPSSINLRIWKQLKLKAVLHDYTSRNNYMARRRGAKQLLIMWCDAITRGESAQFELEWFPPAKPKCSAVAGLSDASFETPRKKMRCTNAENHDADDMESDDMVQPAVAESEDKVQPTVAEKQDVVQPAVAAESNATP